MNALHIKNLTPLHTFNLLHIDPQININDYIYPGDYSIPCELYEDIKSGSIDGRKWEVEERCIVPSDFLDLTPFADFSPEQYCFSGISVFTKKSGEFWRKISEGMINTLSVMPEELILHLPGVYEYAGYTSELIPELQKLNGMAKKIEEDDGYKILHIGI